MMKVRKTVVAVGVAFGISASLLAMIPSGRHSKAAIAVIDQKNIEEAIKTAIQTAKILSAEHPARTRVAGPDVSPRP